jgi:hypothetical protein
MFEQTFKNIGDILFKDAGADSELDYTGQTSWVLVLRYLDELELEKADEAELRGQTCEFIIEEDYRWNTWANPKDADGKLLEMKHKAIADAKHALGDIPSIRKTFIGFQKHLYEAEAVG